VPFRRRAPCRQPSPAPRREGAPVGRGLVPRHPFQTVMAISYPPPCEATTNGDYCPRGQRSSCC
jgi:hypothetical protein